MAHKKIERKKELDRRRKRREERLKEAARARSEGRRQVLGIQVFRSAARTPRASRNVPMLARRPRRVCFLRCGPPHVSAPARRIASGMHRDVVAAHAASGTYTSPCMQHQAAGMAVTTPRPPHGATPPCMPPRAPSHGLPV